MLKAALSTTVKKQDSTIIDLSQPRNKESPLVSHRVIDNRLTSLTSEACEIARHVIDCSSSGEKNEVNLETPPSRNWKKSASVEMHNRLMTRGRKEITKLVRKKEKTDDEKTQKKKLKRCLNYLEKEKNMVILGGAFLQLHLMVRT